MPAARGEGARGTFWPARVAVAVALLLGCGSNAPPVERKDCVAIATRADDEGVFLRFHGPARASYYLPNGVIFAADAEGNAYGGMLARDVPAEGTFDVVAKWGEHFEHAVTVRAETTLPVVVPALWIDAGEEAPPTLYAPEATVDCSGACEGRVTFRDGVGWVSVRGTTGCTLRVGGQTVVFDEVPKWDESGRPHRRRHGLRLDLLQQALEVKLPDALLHPLELPVTFECPAPASAAAGPPLVLGVGAIVTALRAQFHARPFGAASTGKHRSVLAVHGSQYLDGLDTANELVWFFGAPVKANDVDLVAKVKEAPGAARSCPSAGTSFMVEPRAFTIEVYERDGSKLSDVAVSAPAVVCSAAAPPAEGDVRVVRPSRAAVEAALRALLDAP